MCALIPSFTNGRSSLIPKPSQERTSLADKIRASREQPPEPRGVPADVEPIDLDEPERPSAPNLPVMLTPSQRAALSDATARDLPAAAIVRALLEIWKGSAELQKSAAELARAETARLRVRKVNR